MAFTPTLFNVSFTWFDRERRRQFVLGRASLSLGLRSPTDGRRENDGDRARPDERRTKLKRLAPSLAGHGGCGAGHTVVSLLSFLLLQIFVH